MKVQGKQILILPESNPEKTDKGVIIPKTVGRMKNYGNVIDCGAGCKLVKKGDRVIYNPKNGSIMKSGGVEHHFIAEEAIYYVYEKDSK